jgi:hypothetical protein
MFPHSYRLTVDSPSLTQEFFWASQRQRHKTEKYLYKKKYGFPDASEKHFP